MFKFLDNVFNNNTLKSKDISLENIVKLFKNNKQNFDKFEKFYKNNILTEISDNYFEVNSRQAKENLITDNYNIDYELVDRVVNELVDGTELIEVKNNNLIIKTLKCEFESIKNLSILEELDKNKQIQFTRNLTKYDIPQYDSIELLLTLAKTNYDMFRGALETLDVSPILYQILSCNKNSIGYWLPKIIEISDFKIPNTKIIKVPLSLLQLGRVFEYNQITPTTFEIINRYCQKVFELDINKSYFIKNGVYSSKFDFRNAKVTSPQEVKEIGQYLFYIHQQACQMANLLNNISIYGCGTTNEWVAREYIESNVKEKIYMGLPLNTEYRVFVDFDRKIILSSNQYWDKEVMTKRFKENRNNHDVHDMITFNMALERLEKTYNENIHKVKEMVQKLIDNNIEMKGQWSIDIMQVGNEFYLIDMALAENSYYYDRIPKELRKPIKEDWLLLQK